MSMSHSFVKKIWKKFKAANTELILSRPILLFQGNISLMKTFLIEALLCLKYLHEDAVKFDLMLHLCLIFFKSHNDF